MKARFLILIAAGLFLAFATQAQSSGSLVDNPIGSPSYRTMTFDHAVARHRHHHHHHHHGHRAV